MRINDSNTSIRGFFIYSPDVEYELGDFVVKGNTIYICSPKDNTKYCIGEDPATSNNYSVYLGDNRTTLEEIKSFIDGDNISDGISDKYISLSHLPTI